MKKSNVGLWCRIKALEPYKIVRRDYNFYDYEIVGAIRGFYLVQKFSNEGQMFKIKKSEVIVETEDTLMGKFILI